MARSRRRRTAGLMVGLVALAASIVVLFLVWISNGLDAAANVGQLVGVALSIPALLIGLVLWWRTSRRVVPPETVETAAKVLARLVTRQWENEAAIRSLDDPDPIAVQWQLTASASLMDHNSSVSRGGTAHWEGASDQIEQLVDQFHQLRRRRLAVLGAAGSGKTTLAVQILRELLRTRRDEDPVPVLVSAASWNAHDLPDLWTWLTDHLTRTYHEVLAADELAADRRILPILDGLDEVPLIRRAAILKALNRSLGRGQLIITCRTAEYHQAVTDAGDVVTGAAVIESVPLRGSVAADYLASWLPPEPSVAWQRILDALRDGTAPALVEACSTPLGLWLLRTAGTSQAGDVGSLADPARYPSAAVVKRYLFDQLIPAVIDARPPTRSPSREPFRPSRRYDPDQATRWLRLLAAHLAQGATPGLDARDFGWWDVDCIPVPAWVPRTIGAGVGFAGGIAIGFTGVHLGGFTGALMGGIFVGFLCGLVALADLKDQVDTFNQRRNGDVTPPIFLQAHLRSLFIPLLIVGAVVASTAAGGFGAAVVALCAAAMGVIAALAILWLDRYLTGGLAVFLVLGAATPIMLYAARLGLPTVSGAGLLLGLVGGLASGLNAASDRGVLGPLLGGSNSPKSTSSASAALRTSRNVNLLRMGGAALLAGLVHGTDVGLGTALVTGLAFGLAAALADRRGRGGNPALTYLIVTHLPTRRRRQPRRFMTFLDDVHRLGLLRRTGPVYQFRHIELQDHLVARPVDRVRANGPTH